MDIPRPELQRRKRIRQVAIAGGALVLFVIATVAISRLEAAGEAGGVRVRWCRADGCVCAEIEDDGPGLANTENLWVPFFTTKRGGSGIGLALSREIVENHGGRISLENRAGRPGCVARFSLPLA